MSALTTILAGLALWLFVATVIALIVGRLMRASGDTQDGGQE